MTKCLLMIHGVGCGGEVWDVMRQGFEADGWSCETPTLFPDLRTKQAPPEGIARLDFQAYVDDMASRCRSITEKTGEKPTVIGHSMGGLIAQSLAAKGLVSKAVFLTPAQPKDCTVIGPGVAFTFANILITQNRKKGHKIWRRGFNWGVLNCVPNSRHADIYAEARFDSGGVYGDLADGIEIDESQINVPTLTIAATKDRATLAKAVRRVAAKYAKSPVPGDFIEYPDHAHWIVDEPGTDKVTEDIVRWLTSH